MELFRATKDGGVRAWVAAAESALLRNLVGQIGELVDPGVAAGGAADATAAKAPGAAAEHAADDRRARELDELEALFKMGPDSVAAPQDPVLARLLPDGYKDDPEAAGEFRKYTEYTLRSVKYQAAQTMLETLPEAGGRIKLTAEQAHAWLRALNDVRLVLGVQLEVTEDFEQQWQGLDSSDPARAAFEVYAWLGAVQESLVQAMR